MLDQPAQQTAEDTCENTVNARACCATSSSALDEILRTSQCPFVAEFLRLSYR